MVPRRFIRHPADIPIEYSLLGGRLRGSPQMTDVGGGGICFRADGHIEPGTRIQVKIPVKHPPFVADGVVVWSRLCDGHYRIGLEFDEESVRFAARMVEQICYIEQYRREILLQDGRNLSGTEAAAEWVAKHAATFPDLH